MISRGLEALGLGVWVGTIIFFSFFVAPTLFNTLDHPTAALAVNAIFPRYYADGNWFGAMALIGAAWHYRIAPTKPRMAVVALLVAMLAIWLYGGQVLLPAAHAAKGGLDFAKLHRLSVTLNGTVLLLGLVAFVVRER